MSTGFLEVAGQLAAIGRRFDARGWVLGTSGNFSAVTSRNPLRLAITRSAVAKGDLTSDHILELDEQAHVLGTAAGRPSAEALLHLEVVRQRQAGAVLHTHSTWSTIVSDRNSVAGGLWIEGYEMLKGLEGVTTHEHREWLPILPNAQDMTRLAAEVARTLLSHPESHGFLLQRHGLYTWGTDLPQATRHVEILEFLLEVVGKTQGENSLS